MSKLFFDHLIYLEEVEIEIKKSATSKEEKEELWSLVDEIINHKVLEKILDRLPEASHVEFMDLFHKHPHDEELVFGYLKSKTHQNIEKELEEEFKSISAEILKEIKSPDETSRETKVSKK